MACWFGAYDYADKSTVSLGDFPNDEKGISRVMVVPADGLVINQANCGDSKDYNTHGDEITLSLQNDPFPAYKIGEDGKDINSLTQVKFNWSTLSPPSSTTSRRMSPPAWSPSIT